MFMNITQQLLDADRPLISVEFFPPKTEAGKEKLIHIRNAFGEFSPEFYSMTYGAGGSTRTILKI